MEKEQAFNLIKQICSNHSGNLQDHQAIQTALDVINKVLLESEKKPDKKTSK